MTALILHPDPEVSARLEQDYLVAGAMVFKSGNAPNTQHYEVSNPHHHAALIYRKYNTEIFGAAYAQKLAGQAMASLVIDADVIIAAEDLSDIFQIGKELAVTLNIPVVSRVEDVFADGVFAKTEKQKSPTEGLFTKDNIHFFLKESEVESGQLSDSSISDLEVRGVPWYSASETYQPGQPCIKLGAIIFPGGVLDCNQ